MNEIFAVLLGCKSVEKRIFLTWSTTTYTALHNNCILEQRFHKPINLQGRRGCDRMVVGIYNYLSNQCLSPLMLWVRLPLRCATLCDKFGQWLAVGRWFSLDPSVSSNKKTDCHDITEILLKVALNTIKPTNQSNKSTKFVSKNWFSIP